MGIQLRKDAREIRADGALADLQALGDLPRVQPLRGAGQRLDLAPAQQFGQGERLIASLVRRSANPREFRREQVSIDGKSTGRGGLQAWPQEQGVARLRHDQR